MVSWPLLRPRFLEVRGRSQKEIRGPLNFQLIMNRFFYFILVLGAAVLSLYFRWPWFIIAIIALVVSLPFRLRRRSGFWFAFVAVLFVWGTYLTYIQFSNDGILADRVGQLFTVGNGSTMVAISAFWGALTGGLGGWTGVCLRKAIKHEGALVGD